MRKSSYRAYKAEPNDCGVDSTGGRRTPETIDQSKTDSRGGANPSNRGQIGRDGPKSTDSVHTDNNEDVLVTDGGPDAGRNGEELNTTQAVFRALEELGGEREEAPVGNVINRVVVNHERPLGDVLDEVSRLMANGEIYAPSAATIRRTDGPVVTDGSGDIDTSFVDAVQEQLYIGDHVEDKDDGGTMIVVGLPGTTAKQHVVNSDGMEPAETVADYNPDYPAADEVVEVAYTQRTDNHLDVDEKYAFPRSRLERVASTHDLDDDGGESDA